METCCICGKLLEGLDGVSGALGPMCLYHYLLWEDTASKIDYDVEKLREGIKTSLKQDDRETVIVMTAMLEYAIEENDEGWYANPYDLPHSVVILADQRVSMYPHLSRYAN